MGDVAPSSPAAPTAPPLRVLHVVTRSHRRGAELVAVELAAELDARGHTDVVVALAPAVDGGEEPGLPPLERRVPLDPRALVTHVRGVRHLLVRGRYDAVLAHGGWPAQVVALAALTTRGGAGRPRRVWQRILGFPESVWRPGRREWWRTVAARFDGAVALTTALERELRRLPYRGPVWIVPNSRRTERFEAVDRAVAGARLRAELPTTVAPDAALVGFVGHLVDQKQPAQAIDVIGELVAAGRRAHLVVAGDGPLRADLDRRVAALGLADHVTFLGHRADVEWVLGGVDVAVLTSAAEGIPGVAIEAVLSGCPLVSYPVGGVDEVVDQGVTGVIVVRPEPDVLAAAVGALLDDPDALAAMSRAGRRQTERFSAATTARRYEELLSELVSAAAR